VLGASSVQSKDCQSGFLAGEHGRRPEGRSEGAREAAADVSEERLIESCAPASAIRNSGEDRGPRALARDLRRSAQLQQDGAYSSPAMPRI
jgi:hypothetical protein